MLDVLSVVCEHLGAIMSWSVCVRSQLATPRAEVHNQPAPLQLFFSRPLSTDFTKRDLLFREILPNFCVQYILISAALLVGIVTYS